PTPTPTPAPTPTPTPTPPATPAGVTTPASVQASIEQLSAGHTNLMVHQHAYAMRALGGDQPLTACDTVEAYGSGNSGTSGGAAGLIGRRTVGDGLCLMGGLSWQSAGFNHVIVDDTVVIAGALRKAFQPMMRLQPFAEIGGWYAGNSNLTFTRSYIN